MLPDFPRIKKEFEKALNKYLRNLVQQEPLLSRIKEIKLFEGRRFATEDNTGEIDNSHFQEIQSELIIERDEIIRKGILAYIEKLQSVAQDIQRQKAKMFFDKIASVTEKTGNVVDAKGQPFAFEHFYTMIEKVQIEFDETGNPFLPTIFISPQLGARIKEMLPQWKENPEYDKRMKELLDKKRMEWYDRESNRKLVD